MWRSQDYYHEIDLPIRVIGAPCSSPKMAVHLPVPFLIQYEGDQEKNAFVRSRNQWNIKVNIINHSLRTYQMSRKAIQQKKYLLFFSYARLCNDKKCDEIDKPFGEVLKFSGLYVLFPVHERVFSKCNLYILNTTPDTISHWLIISSYRLKPFCCKFLKFMRGLRINCFNRTEWNA